MGQVKVGSALLVLSKVQARWIKFSVAAFNSSLLDEFPCCYLEEFILARLVSLLFLRIVYTSKMSFSSAILER